MKIKKMLIILIFSCLMLIGLHTTSYAGSQEMKNLNYDAKLNLDGSMDVVETWNIYVDETNTLFKTFDLDSSKYKGITDVEVSEIGTNGSEKSFSKINEEMYHVTKNCYYGLQTESDTFEIAWGVGLDNSSATKTYKIKYKVLDVVKVYDDCSELYWMFLSEDNAIPIERATGTIHLPKDVTNKENLRAWAHGPLNGEIQIPDTNTVTFEIDDLSDGKMLEIRVATLEDIFYLSSNKINENKFESILAEETKWAEDANNKRMMKKIFLIGVLIIVAIVSVIVFIILLKKIFKYRKILKELPDDEKIEEIQYFRDIPDETATPADAAFLYYFDYVNKMEIHLPKILSATLLNLCMKKKLEFEIVEQGSKEIIQINLKQEVSRDDLEKDEKQVYELLEKVAKNKDKFTMKDLEKYAQDKSSTFLKSLNKLKDIADEKQAEKKNYDKEVAKQYQSWNNKFGAYLAFGICLGMFSLFAIIITIPVIIELIINAVLCRKISKKYNSLTTKGKMEKEQWRALNRYMEEFSMMDEKTLPELVLWEKYLMFATVFGSADKVIKQLKIKYPQLQDDSYMSSSNYHYLYLMNRTNFQTGFVNSLNQSVSRAYTAGISASSSGGGYGGGFSSGGGGRRWRRPEWAEDNKLNKY